MFVLQWPRSWIPLVDKETVMAQGVKLRRAGGSIVATLPKDMADRLKLQAGDTVIAIETDQGILLIPYDPVTEKALSVASRVGCTYRNALRELAK
jgi:putative addiction module antidote